MDWLYWFRNSHYCRIKSCKTILELHKGEERMNDFVLRGFCQKCNRPQIFGETTNHNVGGGVWEDCEPVWFLSPQQMRILCDAKEPMEKWFNEGMDIPEFVEKYPFLVAKILSDAGKDS